MKGNSKSKEFWKMMGEKMSGKRNICMGTAEKGGKGLKVLGKGENIKFYLDGFLKLNPTGSVHFLFIPKGKVSDRKCRPGKINSGYVVLQALHSHS